ncbi:ATP-binding protein [Streptomyces sp. SP18CS02]|uniref:ATP-binding protein n=1 Tax=Streptomyces sp. SP18CS02 TaxID=3002531 RepID=UPI002E799C1D|nr:ATP-binding protein [Streptomyces sp. SP18CS02]MEE1755778.1 ATP-binding protein [Streptomyces sp. SP18CS02]
MDQSTDELVRRWTCDPRCVGAARRALRTALTGWNLGAIEDAALLVLSELLTNAVRHARVTGRQVETRFRRVPGGLRIEVHDASESRPEMGLPDADAVGGRGLPLVDVLADKWGVCERQGPGKVVWAELTPEETVTPPWGPPPART